MIPRNKGPFVISLFSHRAGRYPVTGAKRPFTRPVNRCTCSLYQPKQHQLECKFSISHFSNLCFVSVFKKQILRWQMKGNWREIERGKRAYRCSLFALSWTNKLLNQPFRQVYKTNQDQTIIASSFHNSIIALTTCQIKRVISRIDTVTPDVDRMWLAPSCGRLTCGIVFAVLWLQKQTDFIMHRSPIVYDSNAKDISGFFTSWITHRHICIKRFNQNWIRCRIGLRGLEQI